MVRSLNLKKESIPCMKRATPDYIRSTAIGRCGPGGTGLRQVSSQRGSSIASFFRTPDACLSFKLRTGLTGRLRDPPRRFFRIRVPDLQARFDATLQR